ncbi:MAG TPA: pyrimidine/purine nucleoside phosphorylase, partial [Geobacteraceae bacterium]|nr:pyrimidine/purine nucleoside phosphorylase [Geobacteraceae bacterium]
MSEFSNVTIVREANVYFNGAVTSRTVLFADGSKKTLGIMQPGEYEFSTGKAELMEILSGDLEVS